MPRVPIYFQKQHPMSPAIGCNQSRSSREQDENNPPQSSPTTPPEPLLRAHLDDLSHETTKALVNSVDIPSLMSDAKDVVLKHLYDYRPSRTSDNLTSPTTQVSLSSDTSANTPIPTPSPPWPSIRSVTLILRPMGGVAYTTSLDIDPDHKEIHLSLDYLSKIHKSQSQRILARDSSQPFPTPTPHPHATHEDGSGHRAGRLEHEIKGVVTHEMVHVWQAYAEGTAPGGLTEGVADWVRLRAGLAPPHWKRQSAKQGRKWDDGYETTGWFLDWLESVRVGSGTVRRINEALRTGGKYDDKVFWKGICGADVDVLWEEYSEWLERQTSPAA